MSLCCQLAVYNTFKVLALICYIGIFIQELLMIIGKKHTPSIIYRLYFVDF